MFGINQAKGQEYFFTGKNFSLKGSKMMKGNLWGI
jgi:hypothetical protein